MQYNPFNFKNRLIASTDVQAILQKHNCGFTPVNISLYQTAMVHSSYVKRKEYVSPTGEIIQLAPRPPNCLDLFDESYERLEHLGDTILGASVSTYLMRRFPTEQEGFMTDLKKEIVCNETLGTLSAKMGLDKFYIISRHNEDACGGRANAKKLGDILEAFIGALWTDCGNDFKTTYKFVISLVEQYIDIPKILLNNRNFKEQFQRFCQATFQCTPTYVIQSSTDGIYTMVAVDPKGKRMGVGTSPIKKQAEQLAAKDALSKLSLSS
jgi:ribonuclease-3